MRLLILSFLILTLTACIHKNPEVTKRTPQSSTEFLEGVDKILGNLQDPAIFNSNTCEAYLTKTTDYFFTRPFDYFNPQTEREVEDFKKQGNAAVTKIFQMRLILDNKLKEFYNSQQLSQGCIKSIRNSLMMARSIEDTVMLWLNSKSLLPATDGKTFGGPAPHTLRNPKFFANDSQPVELKSGDVIVMRGFAVVSALIARIGDEQGLFSHAGVVYIDQQTKKTYILESLIEDGYIATPLDVWMKEAQRRTVLFRYADENLAARAAKSLYDYANAYKKKTGKTLPYDFAMNLDKRDKIFCAEVVRLAYELATDNRMQLPTFKTNFSQAQKTGFLKLMDIGASYTFSPNDMDIEPRFNLVAEFRSIQHTPKLRLQDATLEATFDWMERYGYTLHFTPKDKLVVLTAKVLGSLGFEKVKPPEGMSRKLIGTMIKVNRQGEALYTHIAKYEENFIKTHGLAPSYKDLLRELDRYRSEDCTNYYNKKASVFHESFRAGPEACAVKEN